MRVVAHQLQGLDGVPRQQPPGVPCVFAQHRVRASKHPQRSKRDVLEVTDWRADQVQPGVQHRVLHRARVVSQRECPGADAARELRVKRAAFFVFVYERSRVVLFVRAQVHSCVAIFVVVK